MLRGRLVSWFDDPRAAVRLPLRLGLSVVAVAAALWTVEALEPAAGVPVLFPSFVAIVFLSAEVAGTGYGIATMALFAIGYAFFFREPRGGFAWDPRALPLLVAYAAAGALVAGIGGALRKAYARVREEHRAVTTVHEQREDLLRALAHDVRTPLSAVTMNAVMLRRDSEDPGAVLRRARAIEKSAASIAGMLRDLVDTAHLESGHFPLDRKPVDVAGFVSELKGRLSGALPMERVELAVPGGLPAAHVDPQRFERILVNLLSNALKYSPSDAPVVLRAAAQDGLVVVSVADRGAGISQQDLPRIFEKYFRASGARKKDGLGIGLYSTRLLVEVHGGRIWVESALGEGTTFHVAMPTVPPEEGHAARAALAASSATRAGPLLPAASRTSGDSRVAPTGQPGSAR